jgi:hypothetical protein
MPPGVDLDWFWRGWFYTTDHVDIALDEVRWYQLNTQNPEVEKTFARSMEEEAPEYIGTARNREQIKETVVDRYPELKDFYNSYDPYAVSILDEQAYQRYLNSLDEEEKAILNSDKHYYELSFSNKGGLVMPVILELTYEDGSKEEIRIPAEIWRRNAERVSKVLMVDQPIVSITLDPHLETADVDTGNNHWPPKPQPTRFELFKSQNQRLNPMQKARKAEEMMEQGPKR